MVKVLPTCRWRLQGDNNSGCFVFQGMNQWHFCAVPAHINQPEYSQYQLRRGYTRQHCCTQQLQATNRPVCLRMLLCATSGTPLMFHSNKVAWNRHLSRWRKARLTSGL